MSDLSETVVGGRYEIRREIGRGGMAIVWLADDAQHDRLVAIKTLHPDLAGAIATDRFLRELRVTARLQHPSIVPILDSGILDRPDGTKVPWYAMPFLQGESLRSRLTREHQLTVEDSLRIADAVGRALEAAHRENVVHRDIKPENVFLSGEQVYVVDFGIAKALGGTESERLTNTGLAIGTPAYMSPEQSVAGTVDARSDQYGLATILYEMLIGEPPFTGSNAQAIFARRLAEPARSLTTVRPTVPEPVERAILRALERTPADRFPSISAFLAALRAPESERPRLIGSHRRFRAPAVVGVVVVVAAAAVWGGMSREEAASAHVADAEVVALYQRAVSAYNRRTPAGVVEAISTLRAALARDSVYAPAWNALAKAYTRAHQRAFRVPDTPPERLLPLAIEAVDRSLALDSTSADAWMTHGILTQQVEPIDIAPALRSIRRSLALDSTQAQAWHYLAVFRADAGDLEAALEAWRRGVRLDPAYEQGVAFLALGHYWRWDFDSAAVWADSALTLDPNYLLARTARGYIAVERGEFARGEAAFEAARRLSTDVEIVNSLAGLALVKARSGQRAEAEVVVQRAESLASAYQPIPLHTAVELGKVYAALGDVDRTLRVLRRYQPTQDAHFQLHLRCDPPFAPIARDQRFRALVVIPRPAAGKGC